MDHLTAEEKVALVERHAMCEIGQDWDGAWATLSSGCYYDFLPLGIRLRGRRAINEQWNRTFAVPQMHPMGEAKMNRWIRDDDIVVWTDWPVELPDGSVRTTTGIGIFTFAGGKIASETVFVDDVLAPLLHPLFDEEFMRLPGVERLPV